MKILCALSLMLLGMVFGGCGLVDSYPERERRIAHLTDLQTRMMVDDFDYLILLERSSMLSEYHPHVGR